jgi:glyoxylase-like metal-dependent hydrolase (beta-lactamase superfamily II)
MPLILHSECGGPVETNGYLVSDGSSGEAAVIDAPAEAAGRLVEHAKRLGLRVRHLLLTHAHWDHIAEHHVITAAAAAGGGGPVTVGLHPDEEGWLRDGQPFPLNMMFDDSVIPRRPSDFPLLPGQDVTVGRLRFRVIHAPGHSPGSVVLYVTAAEGTGPVEGLPAEGIVFGGDALFAGSVGRCDLPGGDWNVLAASLRSLFRELPPNVTVYPGHGPPTTPADERTANGFVAEALARR